MNNSFNFSEFSRQSPKGILVIYINLIYRVIKLTWIFLFIILKDFSKISNVGANYFYLGLVSVLIFLLVRAYLIYKNFQFKIDGEEFILKQGILKKTNTSVPFYRIQNINFKQNIIQQIINVFEVSIETAGSTKSEISIKALSYDKAKALKEIISNSSSLDTKTFTELDRKPLVKISVKELFKVSLTENHLQNLFLFLALVLGFFQQIQQIADSLGRTESLDGFISESTDAVSTSFFVVFILIIILTITALISSFVRIFLIHFNLVAYLNDDSFEINQGLFTKKSIVLKKQKVQNITVSTNPIKRIIGISFITFKQAVSGKLNKKKNKLIKIVGCKKDQVATIKSSLFDFEEVEFQNKQYPDSYYKKRVYIFSFLFLIALYIGVYFLHPHLEIFYSTIITVPLFVFLIRKKLKKRFYKITDSLLLVGRGLLETHATYLEVFKVQNIKLKQTFFQKKSNVADIILQTASGKITIPCLQYNEAIKIYNHALYKVEISKKSWM
ncbi:PH domain-containing protein [Polaribacter porphyrae]|uniref:YdbS-like PH domain-containing protein n=1 Tax=Polaribacter porphyrae TaxID=1137780 RepID=A0A2S7WLI5_9FLAO|nr:PH domain-containing protein [Polaribacter porphyrae]PQJ78474.1 hypothetical protein BTO18_04390 [Polaribacter porphyrae]